jgi:hypothetical protein
LVLLRQALLVAVVLTAGCTFQFLEEGPYEAIFERAGQSSIRFEGVDGDVDVQGSEGAGDVLVRGTRRALGSTRERAEANLRRVKLEPRTDGAELVLGFHPPIELIGLLDLELNGPSALPAEVGFAVSVSEGDLSVSDLSGDIDVDTGDGDVAIVGAGPGLVTASTDHGAISVEALGPVAISATGQASLSVPDVDHSPVDIETGGGPIVVKIVPQAMEITVELEGGELTVDPTLGLEPVSGGNGGEYLVTDDEEYDGPWKLVRLSSYGGDVEIEALP